MKTVLVHGCFDVIHYGHLKHLQEAKKYGERLVVSVTSDRFVRKGPGRPYFSAERRVDMLRALSVVDEVWICDEATAIGAIRHFHPDVYAKGPDYKDLSKDVTGEIINEKREVEKYGGQLVFTNDETHSSSNIINRFFAGWSEDQKAQIETINSIGGMASIESALNEVAKLKVLVVGEPILDVYRFVHPEGISSKSPTVSCRFIREEQYRGGSWAIQGHLKDFCSVVDITHDGKIAKKIRYISGTQRVFEVTEIDDSLGFWQTGREGEHDVIVAADFGHGMFAGYELEQQKAFIGLNVQANSSNYGFNVYTKHKKWNYLCLDTREIRLAMHDRHSNPLDIANKIYLEQDINRPLSITLGPNGATLFADAKEFHSPAFSDVIVDATGAGDAYFAITTVLLASRCNPQLVPFIGNIFAGLKTKIIGNKASVSKASLLKACKGVLS